MEDKTLNEHKNVILKSGNVLLKKYFYDNQIFHDCLICKIDYNVHKNKLVIDIQHDIFEVELKMKKLYYKIIFNRIFEVKFIYNSYVVPEYLNEIDWSRYFIRTNKFTYLYGYFSKSNYHELATKYLHESAMRVNITTDMGVDLVIDCLDIDIIEPKKIKKVDIVSVFQKIYNTDYR